MRFSRSRSVLPDIERGEAKPIGHHLIQLESSFLKLPVEVRGEILQHLLSQQIIHFAIARTEEGAQFGWPQGRVKSSKPRIVSQWCALDCNYKFNDTHEPGGGKHYPSLRRGQALNFLLICRQVYWEAIDMLYLSNIFDFVDLLSFGDFVTQFHIPLSKIRLLQARHKVPTLGSYSRLDPPAGLRAAVKLSWDGPAMFVHFISNMMPQLRNMKLLFERTWMTSEYEAEYSKRHAEWVRYIAQLSRHVGQPEFVRALGLPWDPSLQAADE